VKSFFFLCLSFFFARSTLAMDTGNVLRCKGDLQGVYAVDYLRMLKADGTAPALRPPSFGFEAGVMQLLGFVNLSYSAMNFIQSAKAPANDFSQFNVWQEAAFGFDPQPLGPLLASIPTGCHPVDDALHPVLVLNDSPNNRIVQFDPHLRAELAAQAPTQMVMLEMRAWLSEFTDDDDLIHAINALMFRTDLTQRPELLQKLKSLFQTLSLSPKTSPQVCQRSQFFIDAFQRIFRKNCDQITAADLEGLQELQILDQDRHVIIFNQFEVRKADLDGLKNLKSFEAGNLSWFGVALFEGFFANAEALVNLDLSHTQIQSLQRGLLPAHKNLRHLNFAASTLDEIGADAFNNVFSEDPQAQNSLDLSNVIGTQMAPESLHSLENLKSLNLAGANFEEVDLSGLKGLEHLDLSDTVIKARLRGEDFPHLKELKVPGRFQGELRATGNWPALEILNASMQGASVFGDTFDGAHFPALRDLDISYNAVTLGRSISTLTHLQRLNLADTDMLSETLLSDVVSQNLPPSVELLEVCSQTWSDPVMAVRAYYGGLMKKRPDLKVKTRMHCHPDEEWIDVAL
jgi:Leucine-rich repeat (LRR) protein